MHEDDEEFLKRVRKEEDEGRLELKTSVDAGRFDKIMKRLINEPPTPKKKKRERAASQNPESDKGNDNAASYAGSSTQKQGECVGQSTGPSDDPREHVKIGAADNEHRAKEESYWNRQALWQAITAFAAIGAFATAAYYACQAKQQVSATKEANRLTQTNALASDRPWVGPNNLSIAGVVAGQAPTIKLTLRNYGKSPAISVDGRVISYYTNDEPSADTINQLLRTAPHDKTGMLFPEEAITGDVPSDVISKDRLDGLASRSVKLVVIACITYKDSLGQILHHTWVYAMYAPDKNMMMIQRRLDLPPDD
jgi:hypothetical protein